MTKIEKTPELNPELRPPKQVEAAALAAANAARAAYLAEHPEPRPVDFTCPRCKAAPGQPCTGRMPAGREAHLGRQDRAIWASYRRFAAAEDAANAAFWREVRRADG